MPLWMQALCGSCVAFLQLYMLYVCLGQGLSKLVPTYINLGSGAIIRFAAVDGVIGRQLVDS